MENALLEQLGVADPSLARLIPVVADSHKEARATSVLLATLQVVPEFAKSVLTEAGASISKRTTVECYTEVAFNEDADSEKKPNRPDGLIVVTNGKKVWSALVESKVGRNELDKPQIETYLELAKRKRIDALITISNQFAALPTHHPVKVRKTLLNKCDLFHFSWLSIISRAMLLKDQKVIEDKEQAYVLDELVRYLEHKASGVEKTLTLSNSWKEVCEKVHRNTFSAKDPATEGCVASWHQLLRYLGIQLTDEINRSVGVHLSRKYIGEPALRLDGDMASLRESRSLQAELDVPDAASRICIKADFSRKAVDLSMTLSAPQDKKRPASALKWLTRQLKNRNLDGVTVSVDWPRKVPTESLLADKLIGHEERLIPSGVKEQPKAFRVTRIVDLGAKMKSTTLMVRMTEAAVLGFYQDIGQHLSKWQPKAPKVKETKKEEAPENNTVRLVADAPSWLPWK